VSHRFARRRRRASRHTATDRAILWGERRIVSIANLTRRDGIDFIALAQRMELRTTVATFSLERANEALAALRVGALAGTAVIEVAGAGSL
jgi:propanol-preferring alcohol dehydrogenase